MARIAKFLMIWVGIAWVTSLALAALAAAIVATLFYCVSSVVSLTRLLISHK